MSFLTVFNISRKEEENYLVNDISFTQQPSQKIAIAGATGSGKTTLLKIIAGLIQPTKGVILFEEERVKGPDEKLIPGHPQIAYLSQHFELRNNYRVAERLEMASTLSDEEVAIICEACRIDHLLQRWTHQLSGGERQRIALALTLVTAPKLLLLDEPFSNLDALHKKILKSVINELSDTLDITCIIVSHDPIDLLSWADHIIVLKNGKVVQQGTAEEIYKEPATEYVAGLFGKYNVLHPALAKAFSFHTDIEMNRINSFIRPEGFSIVTNEKQGLKGEVKKVYFMGGYDELEIDISGNLIVVHSNNRSFKRGDVVFVAFKE